MFMNKLSKYMNENKTEMGQDLKMNPKEALNLNEMKKVMNGIFSFEHFVNLNVRIIQLQEKFVQQDVKIIQYEEKIIQQEEKFIQQDVINIQYKVKLIQ